MPDDERRVEPRTALVGTGSGTTPERIAELQRRALEMDKLVRKKPARSFSEVLAATDIEIEEDLSDKEKRLRALPKKGPRPALVHPSQRDVYGREEETDETVILKG